MSKLVLTDNPSSQIYAPDLVGRESLQLDLDASFRNSYVLNITNCKDLYLIPKTLRTQGGLRFISGAFSKICNKLSPGLSLLVHNIAGATTLNATPDCPIADMDTACMIFNRVLDLRFDRVLSRNQFVVNEVTKQLEGCLGPETQYLENRTLVELIEDSLEHIEGLTFNGAMNTGRKLFIKYRTPAEVYINNEAYYKGFAFSAHDAGDDMIHAYSALTRVNGGETCLTPVRLSRKLKNRGKRTGSKFFAHLRLILQLVGEDAQFNYIPELQGLHAIPLMTAADMQNFQKALSVWVKRMRLCGIPTDIARNALAVVFGLISDQNRPLTEYEMAAKTHYDLFIALLDDAKSRNQYIRERVEVGVYQLFSGE